MSAELKDRTRSLAADIGDGLWRGALGGLLAMLVVIPVGHHAGWWGAGRGATTPTPSAPHSAADAAQAKLNQAATFAVPRGVDGAMAVERPPVPRLPDPNRQADFRGESASPDAREVADWIARSADNAHMDFVIVDKRFTKVFVFDHQARLRGATPVLLGAAPGDDSVEGIGSRPIADVRPEERTTPAGRFIGERGRNASGEDVVWVDYDAAVSMHRVRATNPAERRLERLATPTVADNRISYGCINVPVAFYEGYIRPTFANRKAVVYVLPEVKAVRQVFATFDAGAGSGAVGGRPSGHLTGTMQTPGPATGSAIAGQAPLAAAFAALAPS